MLFAPIVLSVLAFMPQDTAADAPKLKAAHESAKMCAEATVKGDVEKLISLTHPAIVKLAGGKDAMLKVLKKSLEDMKTQGFKFNESKVEPAKSMIKGESGLYCILPITSKMSIQGKKITINTFLLGVSADDGKTWTFLDGNGGEDSLRQVLADIPKDLKFPAKTQPIIEN